MNWYPMPEQNTEAQAKILSAFQRSEITEYHIYTKIAAITPEPGNRDVLLRIAAGRTRALPDLAPVYRAGC